MIPRCLLHPISVKQLRQGHPWVTLDAYSRRFPTDSSMLIGLDDKKMEVGTLLHDPRHKTVRARLWSKERGYPEKNFTQDLELRLIKAREKRLSLESFKNRENRYWCFAEGDEIPGLMVLQLGERFIIQFYALLWNDHKELLKKLLLKTFPEIDEKKLWLQARSEDGSGQKSPTLWDETPKSEQFIIHENDIRMHVRLGESYDYSVYSDMAAVRYALRPIFQKSKRVLNLYSYTGAFSLLALKLGAERVVSVDLSAKYLAWLEENLLLNDFQGEHASMKTSTENALKDLINKKEQFDFIICDPPSSSSDGQKRTSALQSYEVIWNNLQKLLAPEGLLLSFLNTHTVSMPKFEKHLRGLEDNRLQIQKKYHLMDDCPTIKGFHEGNYLKGILWK
jgi:23S rRNA (cytosine1962-C5)-methyltransferase